ncbi:MAG: insulinase family protein, partial [Myxococcaceae bacterium]|nr:insulinase family protein [Myxococcaceae bacterium]
MTAERTQLPSGLTLVVQAQRTAPVAAFQIWVQAGAADEREGQVGLAHLHEHLLFKGTETTGPGELARAIEGRGGEVNAWTSHDMTAYHCVTASAYARQALEALADAVQHPAFDAGELSREIEVVCEEIKRSEDTPSRRASRALFSAAFPHHPYGRPVLGDAAAVRSHTREKMLGFFQRHYRPERMVLSAVGDLDPAEVRAWATALFPVRPGPPALRDRPPPAERPKGRVVRLEPADLKDVHVQLAFPAPSQDSADLAALDLLAMVLGQGQASALSLFVRQRGLASEASAWAWTPKDPGLFGASLVTTAPNAARALEETVQVLRRATQDLVDPDELRTAQENLESDSIYGRETAQGLARRLAFYEAQMGGLEHEARYLEAARRVTPESLREVARRTIDVDHAIVSVLGPSAALDEARVRAALDAPL